MAEELHIPETKNKEEKYKSLIPQLNALVQGEPDLIANLSNIIAGLKYGMGYFWVGVYFVKGDELVLGPFQGPVACTRIGFGKGVCGTAWKEKETLVVKNVEQFPGHIACSSASKSEIVLPVLKNGEVALIFDIDSEELNDFDETDEKWLQEIVTLIERLLA